MNEVSLPSYWSALYQANDAGWDKGRCAPPIARMLQEQVIPLGADVAVIGCGRGHEALAAVQAGYRVTAVDFAPEAIAAVRAQAVARGLDIAAVEADLFEMENRWPLRFDAIVEHTCLCAIDPERRTEYAAVMEGALKPRGLLLGLLYAPEKPNTPPYAISEAEARQLLDPRFECERFCVPPDSFENRASREFEFIARKRI